MPIFDFRCESCGHQFNLLISNAKKSSVKCPACGEQNIKQLLSPFNSPGSKTTSSPGAGAVPDCCAGCQRGGMGGCGMM